MEGKKKWLQFRQKRIKSDEGDSDQASLVQEEVLRAHKSWVQEKSKDDENKNKLSWTWWCPENQRENRWPLKQEVFFSQRNPYLFRDRFCSRDWFNDRNYKKKKSIRTKSTWEHLTRKSVSSTLILSFTSWVFGDTNPSGFDSCCPP